MLLYRAQEQLHSFLRNFPVRWLAGFMRAFIFPRGLTYFAPDDRLGRKVAELVTQPTEARERLCGGAYTTLEPTNHLGLVQEAMVLTMAAEPLLKKIRVEGAKTGRVTALDLPGQVTEAEAAGILTADEAGQLREYDRKVMEIIHVDDFDAADLAAGREPAPRVAPRMQVA